jgi:hypothetical protein
VRAGYVVCHLSTRNSPAAVAYILGKVDAKHLLVSSDSGIESVARQALAETGQEWAAFVSSMPSYMDIINYQPFQFLPKRQFSLEGKVFYVHSSGMYFVEFCQVIRYSDSRLRLDGFPKTLRMDPQGLVGLRQWYT